MNSICPFNLVFGFLWMNNQKWNCWALPYLFVIAFVLKYILSGINITSPAFSFFPFSSNVFPSFILSGCVALFYFFKIYLFLDRGEGKKEKERERKNNVWFPLTRPLMGTWPITQVYMP